MHAHRAHPHRATPRTARAVLAAVVATLLVVLGIAAPASAEDPPSWTPIAGTAVDADGLQVGFEEAMLADNPWGIHVDDGPDPVPYLRLTAVNGSDRTRWLGVAMTIDDPSLVEPLWEPASWGVLVEEGGESFLDGFVVEMPPGASMTDVGAQFYAGVPQWSGRTFAVVELSGPPATAPTETALVSWQAPGRFVPVRFDESTPNFSIGVGQELEIAATGAASDLFPGVEATATATGLTPGEQLDLWLAPGFDHFFLVLLGGALPADAVPVGTGTVAGDGSFSATLAIPADAPLGDYQLVAGVAGERYWPAGTWRDFAVTEPDAAGSAPTPTDGSALTIPFTATSVSFTYPAGTTAGTTTAAVTATGPSPVGFTLFSDPPLYYHLSSTSDVPGPVQVCIAYDTTALPGPPPRLYHHVPGAGGGYAWVDITTSQAPGLVCGSADGFSPFALGVPLHDGSTAPPAQAQLSDDNGQDTGLRDGDYVVSVDLWWGENASSVRLLENGSVIAEQSLVRSTPNPQHAAFPITGRHNGTYVYTAELTNSTGTTATRPHTVRVTDANPARPSLSATTPRNGAFTLTANLWWGTNATSAQFYEDGQPVGAPIALVAATPGAQSATLSLVRPKGDRAYTVALSNAAGTTWSTAVRVKVK